MNSAELARQFNLANVLRFEDTPGGLIRGVISGPMAEAEIYLQGAHLARWDPKGHRSALFVSSKSLFAPGKAIRGGVPVVFPWFGPRPNGKPGPAHGFARTTEWTLERTALKAGGEVEITLGLQPNESTRAFGYSDFAVRFRVTIGSNLQMELAVENHGEEPFLFEEALHSYFAVSDVRQVSISGLAGTAYIDKTDGYQLKEQGAEAVRIAKETDQVHLNSKTTCVVHDPMWNRGISIQKSGSATTVIWNPWIDKAKSMSDMAPEEWLEMICVETANAANNAVRLAPGESHKLKASVKVEQI